ncbi:ArsR family transcriptional regulator [Amycolatopsis antarctica]|uniref:ArsR family transcriptional regulator n=2 Tax=Amycolatopsis antarctica TaxID=1854586 RepID=A0A263CWQ9_9PSEU|nr:ArsR family transcriptional regulator [Amycolatopsis antarctica]
MVEQLAVRDRTAGELSAAVHDEFGVSQPAASRHLRVLREAGLVRSRVDGSRRIYSLDREGLEEIGEWVDRLRALWGVSLSALDTEIARGKRDRRQES